MHTLHTLLWGYCYFCLSSRLCSLWQRNNIRWPKGLLVIAWKIEWLTCIDAREADDKQYIWVLYHLSPLLVSAKCGRTPEGTIDGRKDENADFERFQSQVGKFKRVPEWDSGNRTASSDYLRLREVRIRCLAMLPELQTKPHGEVRVWYCRAASTPAASPSPSSPAVSTAVLLSVSRDRAMCARS
jgi:hypothetical protein